MALVRRIKCWLHDLPKTRREDAHSRTAEQAIERFLKYRARHRMDRRFIATIQSIYEVGGVDGLALWSFSRIKQGIGSKGEIQQLKEMVKAACNAEERGARLHREWCEKKAAQLDYEHLWERLLKEQALNERAKAMREAEDPRQAIDRRIFRHRLEHTVALPAAEPARERELVEVGAVVSRRALDVRSKPLAAPLMRNEAALAEVAPAAVQLKSHSRQPKGECGQRIAEKLDAIIQEIHGPRIEDESEWPDDGEPLGLDALLAQIRHEAVCQSACCAASRTEAIPVDLTHASVDPPATALGGVAERAPDAHAVGGNGFPLEPTPTATVWDAFSGRPDCSNDTTDFLEQLDAEPRLRSAAMLRSLGRFREALEALPEQSPLDAQVCVSLQDALVLMTQLMQKLR